jgi:hypothetical protein
MKRTARPYHPPTQDVLTPYDTAPEERLPPKGHAARKEGLFFMHQLAMGFAISSVLLGIACGDDYGRADALLRGIAAFEIPSAPGLSFAAEISIFPQDGTVAVGQLQAAEGDASVDVELPPGSYTATLDTFTLFDDGEPVPDPEVTFVGFNPDPIIITPYATTRVSLTFEGEDGTEIESDDEAKLVVNQRGCTPSCNSAQRCVDLDEAGPACFQTCNDDTPCAEAGTTCYAAAGICI